MNSVINIHQKDIDDIKCENIEKIKLILSQSLLKQERFLTIFKTNIIKLSHDKEGNNSPLVKLSTILSELIKELGIIFCELINEDEELKKLLFDLFLENTNNNLEIKKIFVNIIFIYNYDSCQCSFIKEIKDKLGEYFPRELFENKRKLYTEIERFFDDINILKNKVSSQVNKNNWMEINSSLGDKINILKSFRDNKKCPLYVIEFFDREIEKMKNILEQKNIELIMIKNEENLYEKENINDNPINLSKDPKKTLINNSVDNERTLNTDYYKEEKNCLQNIDLAKRTFFYHNELLIQGEDQYTEYKNYSFPLEDHERRELRRQYLGFLNAKGGRIYLGINDNKEVKGINLTYKNRDIFRNDLVGYTNDFYPKCRVDKINIFYIPIKNPKTGKYKSNYFVVKIVILPGDPGYLYCTNAKGGGMVSAIRQQSQVFSLGLEEMHKEIISRHENKNIKRDNYFIKLIDPEPDIVIDIDSESDEDQKSNGNNGDKYYNNYRAKIKKKYEYILRIKNIDKNLRTREINKVFVNSGAYKQNFKGKNGQNNGEGYLVFATEEMARAIYDKFNGCDLGGKTKIVMNIEKKEFFFDENKKYKN